jgi:4-diphosphocytidyl-2-C-methyl-D-erythritol kinase
MLTLLASAKINLTLEVLSKRADGFHEILSIIQAIDLSDCLCFQLGNRMAYKCDYPDWSAEKSLILKAAQLLKEVSGYPGGATIEVSKRIPLLSGLGGDSSDAAAVLTGLNRLWQLDLPVGEIAKLASQLGSDVTYFLSGGTALAQGRGEAVSPLPPLPRRWLVLLIPDMPRFPNKTTRIYSSLEESHYTPGRITEEMVTALTKGESVTPASLFNVFDSVAYSSFAGLDGYRRKLKEAGAGNIHLAGSGPTLFTIGKSKPRANRIFKNLKDMGLETYLAGTLEYTPG